MKNNLTKEQKEKLNTEQQDNLIKWSEKLNIPIKKIPYNVGLVGHPENIKLTKEEIEYAKSLEPLAKKFLNEQKEEKI